MGQAKSSEEAGTGAGGDAEKPSGKDKSGSGTQTLVRGLDIVDAVASGNYSLAGLAGVLGLSRSTTHRLAATLVEHRYLDFVRAQGYRLGPKLLELGHLAAQQLSLLRVAREHLEDLAARTGDTIHLAVRDGERALYLDKISGNRRVEISSRVGERQPLRSTGIGKALILDDPEEGWRTLYAAEAQSGVSYSVELPEWLHHMRDYASRGFAFDLEENEDRIRCVAAPIRNAAGVIAGAISVSSAAQYMSEDRMQGLIEDVQQTAAAVSHQLGWGLDQHAGNTGSEAIGR